MAEHLPGVHSDSANRSLARQPTDDMSDEQRKPWWVWPLLIVALPLVVVALLLWLISALLLLSVVWLAWCPRRRFAIVVYSNSPVWQNYFERLVIPRLGERAVVLNWSERKRWTLSLSVILFRVFAGSRDFNPIAIVFEPLAWPRAFRFYKAFRSFKHGRPEDVEKLRLEFFSLLDALARPKAAS
jgi:hypothetical protein